MVLFMTFSRETVSTVQQLTKKVDLRNAELLQKIQKLVFLRQSLPQPNWTELLYFPTLGDPGRSRAWA
jgi:hypothetical protein